MTTEATIADAINAASTRTDAACLADTVRFAFRRGELAQDVAQRLLRAANAKRDSFGSPPNGCPHGQPTRADCNTCCIGG